MAELCDLVGKTFGRLTVVGRAANAPGGKSQWKCRCECGAQKAFAGGNLRSGATRSCGCLRADLVAAGNKARAPHGMAGTPTHISYTAMIGRCKYPANASYHRYGAQGVTVCERWQRDFSAFLEDMGERPQGKTLDRIDGTRGYEPGNCRWATPKEQAANRRAPTRRASPMFNKGADLETWAREKRRGL